MGFSSSERVLRRRSRRWVRAVWWPAAAAAGGVGGVACAAGASLHKPAHLQAREGLLAAAIFDRDRGRDGDGLVMLLALRSCHLRVPIRGPSVPTRSLRPPHPSHAGLDATQVPSAVLARPSSPTLPSLPGCRLRGPGGVLSCTPMQSICFLPGRALPACTYYYSTLHFSTLYGRYLESRDIQPGSCMDASLSACLLASVP